MVQSYWFWHIGIFQMTSFPREIISFIGLNNCSALARGAREQIIYQTTLRNDTRILNSFQFGSDLFIFPLSKTFNASSGSDLTNNLLKFSNAYIDFHFRFWLKIIHCRDRDELLISYLDIILLYHLKWNFEWNVKCNLYHLKF